MLEVEIDLANRHVERFPRGVTGRNWAGLTLLVMMGPLAAETWPTRESSSATAANEVNSLSTARLAVSLPRCTHSGGEGRSEGANSTWLRRDGTSDSARALRRRRLRQVHPCAGNRQRAAWGLEPREPGRPWISSSVREPRQASTQRGQYTPLRAVLTRRRANPSSWTVRTSTPLNDGPGSRSGTSFPSSACAVWSWGPPRKSAKRGSDDERIIRPSTLFPSLFSCSINSSDCGCNQH